jgi:hypothetical protein
MQVLEVVASVVTAVALEAALEVAASVAMASTFQAEVALVGVRVNVTWLHDTTPE